MSADGAPREVAIIGDNFMLPERFEQAIRARCNGQVATRTMRLPWPDEPMEHGYARGRVRPGLEGFKEYLVDYDALHEALASGHLGGAVLETFAVEPLPPGSPLLDLPNVTLTPHIAGASVRTVTVAAEAAAEEIRRYVQGEPPLNPC